MPPYRVVNNRDAFSEWLKGSVRIKIEAGGLSIIILLQIPPGRVFCWIDHSYTSGGFLRDMLELT